MKGFAISQTMIIVLGVIVLGASLVPIVYVTTLQPLFPPSGTHELSRWATCSLAMCTEGFNTDGTPSPEVNAVGCLIRENGECLLTCSQVPNSVFNNILISPQINGNNMFYCGYEFKLDFQFSDYIIGNVVSLESGQLDKISNPEWLCKSIMIFGHDLDTFTSYIPLANTADFLKGETSSCLMIAKSGEFIISQIGELILLPSDENYAGGCFLGLVYKDKNFDKLLTPILEFETISQKRHPGGIYIENGMFTSNSNTKSECEYENPITNSDNIPIPNSREIEILAEKFKDAEYEITLCSIDEETGDETCKSKLVNWSELNKEQREKHAAEIYSNYEPKNCQAGSRCNQFQERTINNNLEELGTRISKCNFKINNLNNEKITYSVYAEKTSPIFNFFNNCAAITFTKNLDNN